MGRVGARRLVEIAEKQFGVVTRADLAHAPVSWKWLRGRLASREWNRVHRGVFRLGCGQPTRDEREIAALFAAGEGAVLSHLSAAQRLGLDVPHEQTVHVTIPASRKVKVPGVKVSRSRRLDPREVTARGRLRFTNLARTMIDLASVLDGAELRAALDSALRQNPASLGWIARVLFRHGPGLRGVGRLRALIEEYRRGEEVPDSALESFAVELAESTGRKPHRHYNVLDGRRHIAEVDFAWPEIRLCVQLDGWKYHATRQAFSRDRACDRSLAALGWCVLRFCWEDVVRKPDQFVEELLRNYRSRGSAKVALKRGSRRGAGFTGL